jgi:glycosyltransferase involved in cell wall biosynthesis
MTAGKMQLSVVIPAYNAAKYLGATLESVAIQAHRPAEVVVVDDGSEVHARLVDVLPRAVS